jgi:hypothetical protein
VIEPRELEVVQAGEEIALGVYTGLEPSSAVSLAPAVVWYQGPISSFFFARASLRALNRSGSPRWKMS